MLVLILLAYISFDERLKMSKKFLKNLGMRVKLSTDLPPEIYPSLTDAVNTVLFKKGKNLTQVNNISDAIIHCRGCSGQDIPAGPGLLKEMTYFKSYIELFDPTNGTIARKLSDLLNTASAKSDEGNLTGSGSQVLNCLTLGHYVPQYKYNIPYKCTTEGNVRTCTAEGDASFSGRDLWDFESLQSNSFWENLITETIPGILVSLKGPAIPFGIPYENTVHYKIEKVDQIATEKPTSAIQPPTSKPTQQPASPTKSSSSNLVTSQPTTIAHTSNPITSQPTTIAPTSNQITSQPTTTTETKSNLVTSQPTTIAPTSNSVTSQPSPETVAPASLTGEPQGGSNSNSGSSKKKSKTSVIVAVAVVCVAVVAVAVLGVVWYLRKRKDQQSRIADIQDQIADQTAMQMALIA